MKTCSLLSLEVPIPLKRTCHRGAVSLSWGGADSFPSLRKYCYIKICWTVGEDWRQETARRLVDLTWSRVQWCKSASADIKTSWAWEWRSWYILKIGLVNLWTRPSEQGQWVDTPVLHHLATVLWIGSEEICHQEVVKGQAANNLGQLWQN